MSDCIFCKIAAGEIPCGKVYEDETVLVFRDLNPLAPVHYLAIPKTHLASSAAEIDEDNAAVVGHIFVVAARLAQSEGFGADGFRVLTNCGKNAGQTVPHLHFHILAGKALGVGD